ncbi:MAG: hypothetical protein ABFS46_18995 [Myxococcota bacterium]
MPEVEARADAALLAGPSHPIALVALGLLVVNDHVLKHTWQHPLTGKLSDAAFLIVAPVALGCVAGLLLYPYTIPLSIHLYTDLPAAFFVVLGFWLYGRQHAGASALAFALAIATRQYMVTFPLALAAAELAPSVFQRAGRPPARALLLLLAAASIAAWAFFFEGLAPSPGLDEWPRHVISLAGLVPGYGLHLLTCVGAFFVVPEWLLLRRSGRLTDLFSSRNLLLGAGVSLAFLFFQRLSPDVELGALNRVSLLVLPPEMLGAWSLAIRQTLFAGLAWLACVRFARFDLVFWMLLANVLLMFAAHKGWEKYHLPVIASLWLLRSLRDLERPLDLWSVRDPREGKGENG